MDQKSVTVIHRAFYILLHSVFTLYELLIYNYKTVSTKLLELCHEPPTRNFQKIAKVPNHVTILLGTETPSCPDLANLILWCLAAGVPFVSFYDHKGILKKHEDKLHQLVRDKKSIADHVIWHSHPDIVHKNGYTGRKIHVKVLQGGDGRGGVVDLTKNLALEAGSDITLNSFDRGLKKQFEFPDPDLGVCCGKTFSLYGYPPWQIRVTEFLKISTHHGVTSDTFVKLLCRFSKCEQRYGK